MQFDGKVAVVTGSARCIGRAIALHLARAGADTVVGDIDLNSAGAVDSRPRWYLLECRPMRCRQE